MKKTVWGVNLEYWFIPRQGNLNNFSEKNMDADFLNNMQRKFAFRSWHFEVFVYLRTVFAQITLSTIGHHCEKLIIII